MTILWIRQSLLAFKWNIFKKTKPTQLKIADHKTKEENYLCSNMKKSKFVSSTRTWIWEFNLL